MEVVRDNVATFKDLRMGVFCCQSSLQETSDEILEAQAISRSLCLCLAQQFVRNIQSGSHEIDLSAFFMVGKLKHRFGEGVGTKIKNAWRWSVGLA